MTKYLTLEELNDYYKQLSKTKSTCSYCGHTVYNMKEDRLICNWCYHWVYKNKRLEFQYKMKEAMKNEVTRKVK